MKLSKKKIIGAVITALTLILCLYMAIEVIVANREKRPPSIFSLSISYVPTASMEPTIKAGDYILFNRVSFNDVKVDDVIIYRSKTGAQAGNFIVHRVVAKADNYLITKGDHNLNVDSEQVTADMVCGRYLCNLPILSALLGKNQSAIFLILVILCILVIGLQFVGLFVSYKKQKLADAKQQELEQLKKQILEEELAKLKNENKDKT